MHYQILHNTASAPSYRRRYELIGPLQAFPNDDESYVDETDADADADDEQEDSDDDEEDDDQAEAGERACNAKRDAHRSSWGPFGAYSLTCRSGRFLTRYNVFCRSFGRL